MSLLFTTTKELDLLMQEMSIPTLNQKKNLIKCIGAGKALKRIKFLAAQKRKIKIC